MGRMGKPIMNKSIFSEYEKINQAVLKAFKDVIIIICEKKE